jgi:enoyl-CoA hydratase
MILTGRGVGAAEALSWGLANRVVKKGEARREAEKLAHELAALPQTCLRGDRLSAYEQFSLELPEAFANEFKHGSRALSAETLEGAKRFAGGAGRHGAPA